VGCGIVDEGLISATFGTSGVVFAHSKQYRVEPEGRLHAFCAAVPGEWHLMGVILSAAGSLQWYRDALAQHIVARAEAEGRHPYALLDEQAATVAPGANGLIFLPYLTGERTPHPDPHARGGFIGLTVRHREPHLVRAVIEGVTYGMRDSVELMRDLGIRSTRIVASGGGARSAFWRQMMADVFETDIVLVNATEGAAYGAALLATVAAGAFKDIREAARTCISVTGEARPNPETSAIYNRYYPRYRALYPALKDEFRAISEAEEG
jgi:xylulokinase